MKKNILILFFFLLSFPALLSAKAINLYDKLQEVNAYWAKQTDVPQELYQLPAITNEKEAIRTHLRYVEAILNQRNVTHLSAIEQANRKQNLAILHRYWQEGNFPINDVLPYRNPIFIDAYNNFCAVGFIIKETGNEAISREIQGRQNFAYVKDIKCEKLNVWAKDCGLTLEELAWIQPGYMPNNTANKMKNGLGGPVRDLYLTQSGEITAVGDFNSDASTWYAGFAGWDWLAECLGTNGTIFAIERWGGNWIFGGDFTQINGQNISQITMINANTWQPESMGNINGVVKDLLLFNNELYAAGTFGLAKWDGTTWQNLGTCNGEAKTLFVWNNQLLVGGDFTQIGGLNTSNIAIYNGATFNPINQGVMAIVNDMEVFGGKLFLATNANPTTQNAEYIWLDNGTWFSADSYCNGNFYSLAADGANLYIGGDFTYMPMVGTFGNHLVRVQMGTNQPYCDGYALFDAPVYTVGITANQLFVGGDFKSDSINDSLNNITYFALPLTSIKNPLQAEKLSIFPNPTKDKVNIKHKMNTEIVLFDMAGKQISVEIKSISATESEVNLANLPKGIYIVQAGSAIGKVIVGKE